MPDEVTAAQITAAGQVVASGINYASAASGNRAGRRWALEQYNRERDNALADWDKQNEYNSPAANMARLKAAGLNPNLVYGDGANMPSANIRSAEEGHWQPKPPQVDVTGASNSILAIAGQRNTEAQTDNLKASRELINQQIIKTAAETQNLGAQTGLTAFNTKQLQAKALTDIDQVKANLQQTYANTQYTLDQNERSAAINSVSIQEALQKISNMRSEKLRTEAQTSKVPTEIAHLNAQIKYMDQQNSTLQTDNRLKMLDEALKKQGIQPHDPAWQRAVQQLIQAMPTPKKFKQQVDEILQNIGKYTTVNPIVQP